MARPEAIGGLFLVSAAVFALLGLALVFGTRLPFVGRLPGDIFVRRGSLSLYVPLVTGLLISFVLTVLLNVAFWLWRR